MKMHVLPLVVALMATPLYVSAADAPKPVGQQILVKVEPQPWQTRRAVFADTIDALGASQGKDAVAMARFDGMLTDFEKNPLSLTPMEAMDYYGIFYVPREGATHTPQILQMVSFSPPWAGTTRCASPMTAGGRKSSTTNSSSTAPIAWAGSSKFNCCRIF